MQIVQLHAPSARLTLIVRAKCVTCARGLAAGNSQAEGPRVWRDPDLSTATVLPPDMRAWAGGPAILERITQ